MMNSNHDRVKIQNLAANYERLQGLRLVPLGIATFLAGILQTIQPHLFFVGFAIIFLGGSVGRRWATNFYHDTFGVIRPLRPLSLGESYFTGAGHIPTGMQVLLALSAVALGLCTAFLHWPPQVVVGAAGSVSAATMLIYLRRSQTLHDRSYWIPGAVLLTAASLALIVVVPAMTQFQGENGFLKAFGLYLTLSGLVMTLGGWLDHRLLVRRFIALVETRHAATV